MKSLVSTEVVSDFLNATLDLSRLYESFQLLRADLQIEQEGFSQYVVLDYSEIYRFLHPKYVRADRRENLATSNLILSKPELMHSELFLILPYYYELIRHLQNISETLSEPVFQSLLGSKEVVQFLQVMSERTPVYEDKKQLDRINQFLTQKFCTLLLEDASKSDIIDPISELIKLIADNKLKLWTDKTCPKEKQVSLAELFGSEVYREVFDYLDRSSKLLLPPRRGRTSNRVDSLAAAFVYEMNKRLNADKIYLVLVTSSGIPLRAFSPISIDLERLSLPIARDLHYAQSRIYFFSKYGTREKIISLFDDTLPYMKELIVPFQRLNDYLRHTGSVQRIPVPLKKMADEVTHAWEEVHARMSEDMVNLLSQLAVEVMSEERRRMLSGASTTDRKTLQEIYSVLSSEEARKNTAERTLNAVHQVLENLRNVWSFEELEDMTAIANLSEKASEYLGEYTSEMRNKVLHEAWKIALEEGKSAVTAKEIREVIRRSQSK